MAITLITMSDGNPSTYLTHDVDYLADGEDVDQANTNRPMKNLAARDVVFRDKVNELINELNAAAGSTASLSTRLNVQHNPDGTHTGGTPHGPVAIPVGHTYLSVLTAGGYQNLTANVGVAAGTLCAGDDPRLGSGFVLVDAAVGNYATPKAAIDAGETRIIVNPGTYNDVAGGAMSVAVPILLIGVGEPVWQHAGLTLAVGSNKSVVANIKCSGTSARIVVNSDHCVIDNVEITGPSTCMSVNGDYNFIKDYVATPTPTAANSCGVYIGGDYDTIDGINTSAMQNTASYDVSCVIVAGNGHTIRRMVCECTSIGSAAKHQVAVWITGLGVVGLTVENVRATYLTRLIYHPIGVAQLVGITVRKVYVRNMNAAVLGVAGILVEFEQISAGGPSYVRGFTLADVDGGDTSGEGFTQIASINTDTTYPFSDVTGIVFEDIRGYAVGNGIVIGNSVSGTVSDVSVLNTRIKTAALLDLLYVVSPDISSIRVLGSAIMGTVGSYLVRLSCASGSISRVEVVGNECGGNARCIGIVTTGTDCAKFITGVGNTIFNSPDYAFVASGTFTAAFAVVSANVWKAATGLANGTLWTDAGTNQQIT